MNFFLPSGALITAVNSSGYVFFSVQLPVYKSLKMHLLRTLAGILGAGPTVPSSNISGEEIIAKLKNYEESTNSSLHLLVTGLDHSVPVSLQTERNSRISQLFVIKYRYP